MAMVLVIGFSPLSGAIASQSDVDTVYRITAFSLLIVGAYAVAQFAFGLYETEIQGLNIAWGESFRSKLIAKSGVLVKYPSTYQNGNLAGSFLAIGIPFVLSWKPASVNLGMLKIIGCIFGIAGLFLSGARASLLPFAVLIPFMLWTWLKQQESYRKQILIIAFLLLAIGFMIIYVLFAHSQALLFMFDRYIVQTLSDPTATGRLPMWSNFFQRISQLSSVESVQFVVKGFPWTYGLGQEGLLYILSFYGFISFIYFIFILLYPIIKIFPHNKLLALGLFSVFVQLLGDSPFAQPPTLINYFFLAGIGLNFCKKTQSKRVEVPVSKYIRYKNRRLA